MLLMQVLMAKNNNSLNITKIRANINTKIRRYYICYIQRIIKYK